MRGTCSKRAESMGGFVKVKPVTEMRRSTARDICIAENVYLVLNSLLDSGHNTFIVESI